MSPPRGAGARLWAVILAGGIGSRFWPASRPERPKILLPLASGRPMIRAAVDRALGFVDRGHLAVLAREPLAARLRLLLPELVAGNYWCEPQARGTGPALAWAAHRISRRDPGAILVSLHADHDVGPVGAFCQAVRAAADAARREDLLMAIGVPPDRPETGFGYIKPGRGLLPSDASGPAVHRVEEFAEKPDRTAARDYIASGYLWNTGIFVFPVARFLEELRRHAPEIATFLPLLDHGDVTGFFEQAGPVSVDEAVFERSRCVGAVSAEFRWDDMGSWESVARALPPDSDGNWRVGEAHAVETRASVIWAEDGPVVTYGVDDLVVARSGGITLVTTRGRARELKQLVSRLPRALRAEGGDAASQEMGPEGGAGGTGSGEP
ncbi:MAG: sugar phosphate nucleotidyltransferase [Gammaproteobacteria bacterium]|nr:sugar phosphate nucleotidyltransferase [Gammaproteobacteria bacterium]